MASVENVRVRMNVSVLMHAARQSITNFCCQNASLGRVMIFVDENVILKMYLRRIFGTMFKEDDDRAFAICEKMILR